MTQPHDTWFAEAVSALLPDGPPRTWSVIVSLMGDLLRSPGDQLSGAQLGEILAPAGIRPEAMRVALHRLRADGWIETEKRGRSSFHKLSRHGLAETEAARPRIYATSATNWPNPQMILTEPRVELASPWVQLGAQIWFGPQNAPEPDRAMHLLAGSETLPDWLCNKLVTDELTESYATLCIALDEVEHLLRHARPTHLQRATLRMLIVHQWRRILLSHPDLPDELRPQNWSGLRARHKTGELLSLLPRPGLHSL